MRQGGWTRYAGVVVRFRWLLVVGWLGLAATAVVLVPGLSTGGNLLLRAAVPADSAALATQGTAVREFGVPVLTRVMVVARDPGGLSADAQARALEGAALADLGRLPGELAAIAAAVPVVNTFELFPSASESGTTVVTYLYFRPDVSTLDQVRIAGLYQQRYLAPPGAVGGVTGPFAAEFAQAGRITGALRTVEWASLGIVILVIGLRFRSVIAPLLGIAAVVVSYVCSTRLLSLLSADAGLGSPGYLEPILVVLLVGIMTDYAVFFLSALRQRLQQ
ncbi:MAG: MMPL family transporter, partial [Microlunatus sp.]|nr:MMPL family transporter [Microlunatus sp.]